MDTEKLTGIVRRCQGSDRSAQEELILAVQDTVYYQCRKMLGNVQNAEDTTQDILISMLNGLDRLKDPGAFWGWLHQIIANRCKNALSRGSRDLPIIEDEEGHSPLDHLEDFDEQVVPDKALDNSETQRMITELVDALPPQQRSCVLMYYYSELSVKEIAAATETSEGTVKSRLNYARRSIKEGVKAYEKQGVKLYGVSPLLFLLYFLRKDAAASGLNETAKQSIASAVLSGSEAASIAASAALSGSETVSMAVSASSAAVAAGANTVTTGIAHTAVKGISAKAIAAVLAGAVALGGISAVGAHTITKNEMQEEIDAILQVQSATEDDVEALQEELSAAQEIAEEALHASAVLQAELSVAQELVDETLHASAEDALVLLNKYLAEEAAAYEQVWVGVLIEKADAWAAEGNYAWALRLIDHGLQYYPENSALLEARERYQSVAPVGLFSVNYFHNILGLNPTTTPITTADGTTYDANRCITLSTKDAAYIQFSLNGNYTGLSGLTYLISYRNGGWSGGTGESMRLLLVADGTPIYDYKFAPYGVGQSDALDLDVSGVQILEIQFHGLNDNLDTIYDIGNSASAIVGLIDFMLHR